MSQYYNLKRKLEDAPLEHDGRPLLCVPSEPDQRDFKYSRLCGDILTQEAPAAIDYRPNLPVVFDQGQRGSCVACAASWTVKAGEEIAQGDFPSQGLSAAYLYTMCKSIDGMPSQEGTTPRDAMQVLQKYGICPEELMPYSLLAELPAPKTPAISYSAMSAAGLYKIMSYAQLCGLTDADRLLTVDAMRAALKKEGPFLVALLVCENFYPGADGKLPLPAGQIKGGHAVGIVGDLPDRRSFVLRNSWGKDWGMDGYALLPYEWITSRFDGGWYLFEAWTAVDVVAPRDAKEIILKINEKTMIVDGVEISLDQPAKVDPETNRSMLPVSAIAGNCNRIVTWNDGQIVLTRVN